MSLIAEMNRDLHNERQDNYDRELPLFAAADAIHKRHRNRLSLFLLLPALIVAAGLLAMVLLGAPAHLEPGESPLTAANIPAASIKAGKMEGDSGEGRNRVDSVNTTREQSQDIALVAVTAKNKQQQAKASPLSQEGPASLPTVAAIDIPSATAGDKRHSGIAEQKPAAPALAGTSVAKPEEPTEEPIEEPYSIEVPAKMLPDQTATENAVVVSGDNVSIYKAISSQSDEDFDAGLVARARQVLRESGTVAAQRVLQDYLASGDKVAQNLPQSAAFYATLLIESGALQTAGELLNVQLGLRPDATALQQAHLRLLLAAGRFPDAVAWVENLPGNTRQEPQVMELYAVALQSSGKFELASYVYRRLLEKNISNARWWMGLAVALDSNAQAIDAKQAYQKVLGFRTLGVELNNYAQQRIAQL